MKGRCDLKKNILLLLHAIWLFMEYTDGEVVEFTETNDFSYCPAKNPDNVTELSWSLAPAGVAYACIDLYTELHCCVQGYDQILWYQKRQGHQDHWHSVEPRYDKHPDHKNQTLVITDSQTLRDQGMYKCKVIRKSDKGKTESLQNSVHLIVYECNDYSKPPLVILPRANGTKEKYELDSTAAVVCEAFYGECFDASSCIMTWWRVFDNGSTNAILSGSNTSRLYITELGGDLHSNGKTTVLHIENITDEDYGRYRCCMSSKYGSKTRDVLLTQKIPPKPYPEPKGTISLIIGAVLGIVALACVGGLSYLYYHTSENRIRRMEMRRKLPTDDRLYDITVVSVTEDEEVNKTVSETLRNKGYTVFDHSDIGSGLDPLQKFSEATEKSSCVLFLVSAALIRDPASVNLFGFTHKTETVYRVFIDNFHTTKSTDKEEERLLVKEGPIGAETLLKVLKVGKCVVWDLEKPEEFWEKLCGYLPKQTGGSATQWQNDSRNTIDRRPLLASDSSENGCDSDTYQDLQASLTKSDESGYYSTGVHV